MDLTKPPATLRISREDADDSDTQLLGADALAVFVNDVVGLRISGELPADLPYGKINFAQCSLIDATAHQVDFSECDFKDCLVRRTKFDKCTFDGGMFATSLFSDVKFTRCTFYNVAAHNSDFHDTSFCECDLTNLLVKSSQFRRCRFERCATSNKVAEMSILDETRFVQTPIQIQTILENFGLRAENLEESFIRSGRIREDHRIITAEGLRTSLKDPGLSSIEKLRLEYFLRGHLMDGSSHLDESLDLGAWVRLYRNPSTFVELLDRFSEFLVHEYDSSRLPIHPLLLLHFITSRLSNADHLKPELMRVAQSIGGTHLILSRIVEEYLEVLNHLVDAHQGRLNIIAETSLNEPPVADQVSRWLTGTGAAVVRVGPRNSPVEIELIGSAISSLLPILALFLATRTRLEILRHRPTDRSRLAHLPAKLSNSTPGKGELKIEDPGAGAGGTAGSSTSDEESLFLLDLGLRRAADQEYGFRLRSIMPGALVIDLRLDVSTTLIGKMRKLLVDLIQPANVER